MIMKVFFLILFILLLRLGCYRTPSSNTSDADVCKYDTEVINRPQNKSIAMEGGVIGGTVVGTSGAVASSQIGIHVNLGYIYCNVVYEIIATMLLMLFVGGTGTSSKSSKDLSIDTSVQVGFFFFFFFLDGLFFM
jgi:hypothetical protein